MKKATYLMLLLLFALLAEREVKSKILVNCFGMLHCMVCNTIMRNCFLSGTNNLAKCIACEEKYYETRPCTHHTENFLNGKREKGAFVELNDHDYLTEGKVTHLISEVIEASVTRYKDGLTDEASMSENYKKKIMQLCLYANFNDNYENAKTHTQASVEEVDKHIQKIVKTYINESNNMERIQYSLKNPALCLKDPGLWVKDRTGYKDNDVPSAGIISEKKLFKPYEIKSLMSSLYSSKSNCNRQFCDRFSDPNECEHNIRVLNQGTCGNCWAFASSTTIAAFRCRKGLGFSEPSVKYVTLCKNKFTMDWENNIYGHYNDNICREGGHLSSYLETLSQSGVLPTSYDVPYNEPIRGSDCPESSSTWSNIWDKVNVIEKILNGYLYRGYVKISFSDYAMSGRTQELIRLLKDYIMEQGSIFVSMEINEKLTFDHDGEKVMLNCEYGQAPDHALVLIGYGDYITSSGSKSSYWLVRNSWGSHWGDRGNFKIDMYGPSNCNGNVLFNAFPLLLEMHGERIDKPLPKDMASTDNSIRYNDFNDNSDRRRNNQQRYDNKDNDKVKPNNRYDYMDDDWVKPNNRYDYMDDDWVKPNNRYDYIPNGYDPNRFDPSRFDPSGFDPRRYDPDRYNPDRYDPSRYDPHGYDPHNYDPHNYDPHNYDPYNYDPYNYDPYNYDPRNYDPHNYDPRNYDPHNYDPRNYDPRNYDPSNYNPHNFYPFHFDPFYNPNNGRMHDDNDHRFNPHYSPFDAPREDRRFSDMSDDEAYPGLSDNRKNNTILRKFFKTTFVVSIGEKQYKRNVYSRRKDEYKEPTSCLRTFSIDPQSDFACRKNCEEHIDVCKSSPSIGECLIKHSPNYKCVYCGM
ncbi:serine-repeat antigen (SERA), putative [Plasmodium ovale wallikeri]|uniref:Serine-repeat antigen (SERA), putative n=1 Tax=Plasmodium ovale wallikeri TaxID=864142 RepID=A0A1A8YL80_PLAOA|nr:serine-repeat antigen (SERA), putative [Plasmodium ovale wallikeri]